MLPTCVKFLCADVSLLPLTATICRINRNFVFNSTVSWPVLASSTTISVWTRGIWVFLCNWPRCSAIWVQLLQKNNNKNTKTKSPSNKKMYFNQNHMITIILHNCNIVKTVWFCCSPRVFLGMGKDSFIWSQSLRHSAALLILLYYLWNGFIYWTIYCAILSEVSAVQNFG